MSTWISKSLTLDILAITIDGLTKVFDRINAEPDRVSPWTAQTEAPAPAAAPAVVAPESTPAAPATPVQPLPPEIAQEQQEAIDAIDTQKLLTQAQTSLRTIAQTEGTTWITNTLFPHFGVQSLNDIPAERLSEVVIMADSHLPQAA